MTQPVTNQFMVFLYTIMTGVLAGLFYDVYAGLAQVFRLRKTGVLVGDIIFWLILTPLIYALVLFFNRGEVRFFVLIGFSLGAGSYFLIFKRNVRLVIIKFIEQLIKFCRLVARAFVLIAMVMVFPFKVLYMAAAFLFRMLGLGMRLAGRGVRVMFKFIIPAPVKRLVGKIAGKAANLLKRKKPGP
ncbi:spore cortex biosynthesis protein YabQ [Desulfotruncus alcoholivorax]|uniref:spore cortex biosynthesis protein YabQ n=1 Tax=Desulfotruncus alcoholivorax TaxID=265477 RepID=UPI0004092A22|nr:spore cortex biosynthesis protein YabQ [Desulfotruncus alcoholivorax]